MRDDLKHLPKETQDMILEQEANMDVAIGQMGGTTEGTTVEPANTNPSENPVVTPEQDIIETVETSVAPESDKTENLDVEESAIVPAEDDDPTKLKHKYSVLQGMYNADTKRFKQDIVDLKQDLSDTKTELLTLKQEKATHVRQERERTVQEKIDELAEHLGPEVAATFKDLMGNISPVVEEVKPVTVEVPQKNNRELSELEFRTKQSEFRNEVSEINPGWMAIDRNTDFHKWLATSKEKSSGRLIKDVYNEAALSFNAKTIALICQAFSNSLAKKQAALDSQMGPTSLAPNNNNNNANDKRIYTEAEINGMQKEMIMVGVNSPEATAIQKTLLDAITEGRVQY